MFFWVILSLVIGIIFVICGMCYENNDCLNFGLSFISGTIVGIFCNVGITKYFRNVDKTIEANNKQLINEKNIYLEQVDSLANFVSAYQEIIANLNAFICSNPRLTDGEDAVGYYNICKALWDLPSAVYLDEKILSAKQIELINETYYHLIDLRNYIEKKEYSQIKLADEALFAIKPIAECMVINGDIQTKIHELESKIK